MKRHYIRLFRVQTDYVLRIIILQRVKIVKRMVLLTLLVDTPNLLCVYLWILVYIHITYLKNKKSTFSYCQHQILDIEILLDLVASFRLFSTKKHKVRYLSRVKKKIVLQKKKVSFESWCITEIYPGLTSYMGNFESF